MKKFAAFLVILSVALFTVGCGDSAAPKKDSKAGATPAAGPSTPAAAPAGENKDAKK